MLNISYCYYWYLIFGNCRILLLIIPAAILALFFNHFLSVMEVLWTFSQYLEALAIVPQIYLISKARKVERIVVIYVTALSIYRCLYLLNWIYRYNYEGHYDSISIVGGLVQTVLYCDFFVKIMLLPKTTNADPVNNDNQQNNLKVSVIQLSDHKQCSKKEEAKVSGFNNMQTILLNPASLGSTTDKVFIRQYKFLFNKDIKSLECKI